MLVNDFLGNSAARYPEKEFCVCAERRLTYAELEAESNRLAHALLDAGVERGDRVAVFLENRAETVISIFGILKAGAAFVLINPTMKPDKLCYILNDCGAASAIAGGHSRAAIEAIASEGTSVRSLVTCGPVADVHKKLALRYMTFEQDVAGFSASPPPSRGIDMDLAAIIYTSGSTGRPKGVAVAHINVVSAANSVTQYLENVPEDIILNVLPLSFGYGLYQVLMSAQVGATLVLERSFAYPYHIVMRIKEERATGFPGLPMIFATLIQMNELDPADLDSVRYVTSAAAALPPAHITRVRKLFRKARLFSMYGVTEAKRVTYLPPEQLDIRPTSVGRGMPNEEVYIVDEEGVPVGPGVVGELVVRGSNVMQGYWGLPEETARVLRQGRYPWEKVLYTGDLFKMDEEGYLYFVSRKDDIIKSRGEKVSPREVENVICELPEVLEAAVIGVPDEILGQAIKAVVVKGPDSTLTERDVIAHCARRLETFMAPKYVEFRADLPKTLTGKIKRMALLDDPAQSDEGG